MARFIKNNGDVITAYGAVAAALDANPLYTREGEAEQAAEATPVDDAQAHGAVIEADNETSEKLARDRNKGQNTAESAPATLVRDKA